MFKSVLVANRGEIAVRIFRTARRMGIATVAVYSDADARALHVRSADRAVRLGPAPAAESYLRGDRVIAAALEAGAEAVHPGYGFLSENPDFAEAVVAAGLLWIGPTPAAIRAMGLKDEAKRIAIAAGVPVLPGYQGEDQSEKRLLAAAKEIGFPVLIKAVAGGGGRGIREVTSASEFKEQLASAQREAKAAFGDERVLVEKLVQKPRHIEVQVFGDAHGDVVHLFERDCSLQRRRQKVIEEAPAPGMTAEVRAAMTDAALKVARAVSYRNAGTVEFIVDGTGPLRPDGFWFLEMNTRLQVEHPVTEAVTGQDLVEWQFRVAAGEPLPLPQSAIRLDGHAVELRLCAEDPAQDYRPSVGRITRFADPVREWWSERLDAGFAEGDEVPSAYDSLIAKLIVHARERDGLLPARETAFASAGALLLDLQISGVRTNAGLLFACLNRMIAAGEAQGGDPAFGLHTGLIAAAPELARPPEWQSPAALAALAAIASQARREASASGPGFARADGWRLGGGRRIEDLLFVEGEPHTVRIEVGRQAIVAQVAGLSVRAERAEIELPEDGAWSVTASGLGAELRRVCVWFVGADVYVNAGGWIHRLEAGEAHAGEADEGGGDDIKAPLPGKVAAVTASAGDRVEKGQALVVLEAMKMEHQLKAPRDGVVASIVAAGAQVKEGAVLVRLAPDAPAP